MAGFEGFRANSERTAIPNVFFTRLMPQIRSGAELRIVLHVFWAIQQKKGSPRFVTFRELLGDRTLAPSLGENLADRVETLEQGLRGALEKGILITAEVEAKGLRNRLYMLNTEADRATLARFDGQGVQLDGMAVSAESAESGQRSNAFEVYENNIGPLTPTLVELLKEAISVYSEGWVVEAIEDAVRNSVRKWTYIKAILKNRKAEGRTGGAARRHSETRLNTDRYFEGKYGHLVKRRFD